MPWIREQPVPSLQARRRRAVVLSLVVLASSFLVSDAFQPRVRQQIQAISVQGSGTDVRVSLSPVASVPFRRLPRRCMSSTTDDAGNDGSSADGTSGTSSVVAERSVEGGSDEKKKKKCGYLFEGKWEQRVNIVDLAVGQKLLGRKLDGCDLLDAKTGPKIFFDCGVGRIDGRGNWQIVHGMLRLGKRGARKSVTKKRVARLSDKVVELYVTQVRLASGQLEVTTSPEQAEDVAAREKKVPASSLKQGDVLVGTVTRVEPYGVFVDVGANRHGLLHIQRVADLFGKYIKKEEGLEKSGLERGAKIRVAVLSNEPRRLFLDFTPDVKEEAEAERKAVEKNKEEALEKERKEKEALQIKESASKAEDTTGGYADIEEDEAAAWAAYAASDDDAADWAAFAAGDEGEHDEDDDIEDALGISTY